MMPMLVDVLLATYNGSRYLENQLDSIFAQTHQSFRVLVSDDGSSDATVAILAEYQQRFGERLIIVPNIAPGRGVVRNFENLMRSSLEDGHSKWVFFCDQDDVWLPQKIECMLAEMMRLEALDGERIPCLVHSDLVVVDESLKVICPSFAKHQRMDPGNCSPLSLLSVNQVTGCAMMVNRALLKIALPLPCETIMHDWWCGLISGSGRRFFIKTPLTLYRQHGFNQIGAKNRSLKNRLSRFISDAPGVYRKIVSLGRSTYCQAQVLQQRLAINGFETGYIENYISWRSNSWFARVAGYRYYYVGPEIDRLSRCFLWFK
jgi:glycosyltransferase involved in cell wall biosynthesis